MLAWGEAKRNPRKRRVKAPKPRRGAGTPAWCPSPSGASDFFALLPGVALEKPRSTPGYLLTSLRD